MQYHIIRNRLLVITHLTFLPLSASFRINLLQPYDTLIRPQRSVYRTLDINLFVEGGLKNAQGYRLHDEEGTGLCRSQDRVNVLQIWNCDQNALKMLYGFDPLTPIGQKLIQVDANDNGVRGHFCVTGDLELQGTFAASLYWYFSDYLYLSIALPYYSLKLKNVWWCDLTQSVTEDDLRVKQYLTDTIFANVCELGNLSLSGWSRSGVGDLSILLEFSRNFRQIRPLLKNVRVNARSGIILPSGKRQNEDLLFAIPFGYDGAVGLLAAGGLDIYLGYYLKAGFDVQIINLFGNTRDRRIKTNIDQTELLLLQKVRAYKDWGLVQRFNLYTQVYGLIKGLSLTIGYQFFKQGDSTISFSNCDFSTRIANTANSLQEVTMHQAIINATYDVTHCLSPDAFVWPYLSVYGRIPFNGRNAVQVPVVGVVLSFDY
jgi:hypothetical protein